MNKYLGMFTLLIVIMVFSSGCGSSSPSVTLAELVNAPEQYSGKTVTVEGIYLNGWGATILTEDIQFNGSGKARELEPAGNSIWFAGILPQDVWQKFYQYTSPEAGLEHYGKIRVTGLFETEGKYGNMNQFKYRITAEKAELLDWTPPE